jgi:hypothetical protein
MANNPPELTWGDGGMKAMRVNDAGSKSNPHRRSRTPTAFRDVLLAMAVLATPAFAQTFKMPCEVEASIPAMEDVKIKPQKVVIEIQSLGKNIFLKMNGPEPYVLVANSLATEEFTGKNLTTAKEMGAFRKHKVTGAESEIRIEQATVIVTAFTDTTYMGKKVRIHITGPCGMPR